MRQRHAVHARDLRAIQPRVCRPPCRGGILRAGDRNNTRGRAAAFGRRRQDGRGELRPVGGAGRRHVEGAVALVAATLGEIARNGEDAVRDIGRGRRIADLIGDDAHLVLLARELEHGPNEVATERAVDPRRPQDHVPLMRRRDSALARRLRSSVGVDRADGILLVVGIGLGAVEHIVGREMDQRDAQRFGSCGKQARRASVDAIGEVALGLGFVHVGIGGGADEHVGRGSADGAVDRVGVAEIEGRASDADDLAIGARRPFDQRSDDLAVVAGDGDPDSRHQCARESITPRRSPP